MKKSFDFLSKALSYVFHPIIIPTIAIGVITFFSPYILLPLENEFLWIFLLFIFITTWLLPVLAIYGFYLLGIIRNLHLDDRIERVVSMIVTSIIYSIVCYFVFFKFRANRDIMALFYLSIFTQILAMGITYFWKISLHTIAIWGLVCYLTSLIIVQKSEELFYPLLTIILLSGCLMTARLYLQKHNIHQIWTGVCLSSLVTGLVLLFY